MFRRKIHESRHGRLTQFCRTPKGDFILAIKFEGQQSSCFLREGALLQICGPQKFRGQFYIHGFHSSKSPHARQFVMRYRLPFALAEPLFQGQNRTA